MYFGGVGDINCWANSPTCTCVSECFVYKHMGKYYSDHWINKGNALGGLACITQFNMINQNVNDVALIRISQQQIS